MFTFSSNIFINGCYRASSAVYLFLGSILKHLSNNSANICTPLESSPLCALSLTITAIGLTAYCGMGIALT